MVFYCNNCGNDDNFKVEGKRSVRESQEELVTFYLDENGDIGDTDVIDTIDYWDWDCFDEKYDDDDVICCNCGASVSKKENKLNQDKARKLKNKLLKKENDEY